MEGFFRRARPVSDARPPALGRKEVALCVRCGEPVTHDQSVDRGAGAEHVICDHAIVTELDRRLEASRALHRAVSALSALAPLRERVRDELRELPDAVDVTVAASFLARMRTAVEVARFARVEQRRLALGLLDALSKRLVELG